MTTLCSWQQVEPGNYSAVKLLFQEFDHHLAVGAVFAGEAPARVFADDPARPLVAIVWLGHRFYVAGQPDAVHTNALRGLFDETIIPEALAAGQEFGLLCYASGNTPEAWEREIEAALAGLESGHAPRQYWECDLAADAGAGGGEALPEGFTLRAVDAGLFAETGLLNLERLAEETRSERPSLADFLERSFGVCVVHEGRELTGWCLSEYNLGDRCEVGIETVEPYRRQGWGTLLARALLAEALARGLARVGWHCWAGNAASGATAGRAGFRCVRDYPSYWARFALR